MIYIPTFCDRFRHLGFCFSNKHTEMEGMNLFSKSKRKKANCLSSYTLFSIRNFEYINNSSLMTARREIHLALDTMNRVIKGLLLLSSLTRNMNLYMSICLFCIVLCYSLPRTISVPVWKKYSCVFLYALSYNYPSTCFSWLNILYSMTKRWVLLIFLLVSITNWMKNKLMNKFTNTWLCRTCNLKL